MINLDRLFKLGKFLIIIIVVGGSFLIGILILDIFVKLYLNIREILLVISSVIN